MISIKDRTPFHFPDRAPITRDRARSRAEEPVDQVENLVREKLRALTGMPAPLPQHAGAAQRSFDGGAFDGDIDFKNVQRGEGIGPGLAVALQLLSSMDPEAIRKAIRDNGDGTFTVRFENDGHPLDVT